MIGAAKPTQKRAITRSVEQRSGVIISKAMVCGYDTDTETCTRRLNGQNGVEDVVPNFACESVSTTKEGIIFGRTGDTESKLKVLVVVSKMVLLHLAHVLWKPGVVQSIVHAVVHDV